MVRLRRRFLCLLAAVLGAAVVVLPAIAGSETGPSIEAENKPGSGIYSEEHHAWKPSSATVGAGAAVAISNPTAVPHGVRWVSAPGTPSCSAGVPVGATVEASGSKWSGTCTFAQPGVYVFYCTVHGPEMTGTITVNSSAVTTTGAVAPPATGGAPTTTTNQMSSPEAAVSPGSPLAGSAAQAIKLAPSQHGRSIRGSLKISQAGAGGRLEVDLLAKAASLAVAGHGAQVQVGRLVRSGLHAGTLPFTVTLGARARHALRAHRRLTLSVRILLSSSHAAARITRTVVLHA
jgi:plastocyanin